MLDPRNRKRVRRRQQRLQARKTKQAQGWVMAAVATLLWMVMFFMFIFVEPLLVKDILIPGLYLPFFAMLFVSIFTSVYALSSNLKRSINVSFFALAYLYLRLFQLGSWLNLLLLVSLMIILEFLYNPQLIGQSKKKIRRLRKVIRREK